MTSALHQEWLADKADEIERQRLMAQAAPVLLEAVKRLLNWDRQIAGLRAEDVAFARRAIAAAEGKR